MSFGGRSDSGEVYEEPTRLLLVMEKLNGPDLFDAFAKKQLGVGIGPLVLGFLFTQISSLFPTVL